jgi:hypothetical protein
MDSEQIVPDNTLSVADHRFSIEAGLRRALAEVPAPMAVRRVLYGLPCPRCGAYFDSELQACPCCKLSVAHQVVAVERG